MSVNRQILKDSVIVTALSVTARGLGFLVPVTVAALFGASGDADAYYLANTVPMFLVNVVVIALSSAFVPVLVEQWIQSPEEVEETIGAVTIVLVVLTTLAIALLALLVPRLLPYLAKGMSSSSLALSVHLTLMLLPMILLSTLVGLVSAALNACRRFVGPALAPGIRAIVVIGVSLVGYRALAIRAVVLGLLGGELLSLLVLSLLAWRAGIKPRIAFSLPPAVKRVLVLSVPMIVGMAAIQFNPIVDRLMAVPLGEGSVSALDYADKVMMIPMTLLGSGFLVVILSHWSQMVAEGKAERLRDSVQKAITTVAFITVPLSLYLFLMRKPLVCLLFQRGAFDEMATSTTSEVLGILALGLTPNIIGLIFVRVQLVFQNTKVLMVLGLVNTIMNLVLNLLLVQLMGLPGIALSTSLAYALIALALWLSSMRNIGNVFHKSMLANLVKVGFSSIAFSLSLLLFSLFSDGSLSTPTLIVSSVVGGVIYLCVAYIQHLEEATSLLTWMGRWLRPATEVLGGDYRESQE